MRKIVWLSVLSVAWLTVPMARAEAVRNGNEMALRYASANAKAKRAVQTNVTGVLHTFRYLKIVEIEKDALREGAVTLTTLEPSSGMQVVIVVDKPVSLELAATLTTNACVSANGRVKSIGVEAPDLIMLDPAVLNHKDRASPKPYKELLHEVDKTAY